MKNRWSLIALLVLLGGLALIAYALLTPVTQGGGHMGEFPTRSGYEVLNIVLAVIGAAMAAGSAVLLLVRDMVPAMVPSPPVRSVVQAAEVAEAPAPATEVPTDDSRLILRLLNGDEREVFRSLVDAGGEQLQRDIVEGTKLSDAKISRVLDRLEGKGLVERERRGMGNVVRIAVDRAS
jgi:uncharacterized membrane protein